MNDSMYVVVVDTRAMSPSQIDGYDERICSQLFFQGHVLHKPNVKWTKSKVANLCGMNMKIYFHSYVRNRARVLREIPEVAVEEEEEELFPRNRVNSAATLLTFDPRTGFPEYTITGKAYVVVDSGDYPLSDHQVWGIQDLISEARDLYHCDPDHMHRGRRQLEHWCKEYRNRQWGPLTIYEPRALVPNSQVGIMCSSKRATFEDDENMPMELSMDPDELHLYYSHRHFPDCGCEQCEKLRDITDNSVNAVCLPPRRSNSNNQNKFLGVRTPLSVFKSQGMMCRF